MLFVAFTTHVFQPQTTPSPDIKGKMKIIGRRSSRSGGSRGGEGPSPVSPSHPVPLHENIGVGKLTKTEVDQKDSGVPSHYEEEEESNQLRIQDERGRSVEDKLTRNLSILPHESRVDVGLVVEASPCLSPDLIVGER